MEPSGAAGTAPWHPSATENSPGPGDTRHGHSLGGTIRGSAVLRMSLADPRQRRAQVLAQLEPREGRAGSSRFSLWDWGRQELFGAAPCPPCVCPFPGIAHPWDEPWQEAAVPRRALAVPALVCGIMEVSSSCFPPKKTSSGTFPAVSQCLAHPGNAVAAWGAPGYPPQKFLGCVNIIQMLPDPPESLISIQ